MGNKKKSSENDDSQNQIKWTSDANNIEIEDFETLQFQENLVETISIKKFLSNNKLNRAFIISPKGLGKTYVLKIKSQQLRNKNLNITCLPKEKLCERIEKMQIDFIKEDLEKFTTRIIWEKTWELCIYILIYCNFQIPLPRPLNNIIGKQFTLSDILISLLRQRSKIGKYYDLVATELSPTIGNLKNITNVNQLAIFIDNIDEAFDIHNSGSEELDDATAVLDPQIWVNSQIAIIDVIQRITSGKPFIKIFTTLRSEAFEHYKSPMLLQLEDYVFKLSYSKEELKTIFENNILYNTPEKMLLADSKATNPLQKLFGYEKIPHSYKRNSKLEYEEEEMFDFVLRHTFERPRELVDMGRDILEECPNPTERNEKKISNIVNSTSSKLFLQFSAEAVPYFDMHIFRHFCSKIESNIFTSAKAKEISDEIQATYGLNYDIIKHYYNYGLLGIEKDDGFKNTKKQFFQPVGRYSVARKQVPTTGYFFLHPSTYSTMEEIYGNSFYDHSHIIGNGLPFDKIIYDEDRRLHLHVGLDRDSLTIVLPELYYGKAIAVWVDSTNTEWVKLNQSSSFEININRGVENYSSKYIFSVYRDNIPKERKQKIIEDWIKNKYHTIFFTKDQAVLSQIFSLSNSVTFCYFDFTNTTLKKVIESNTQEKIYYLCRKFFDDTIINQIDAFLLECNEETTINKVFIDRLFFNKRISHDNDTLICEVLAEDYPGKMVCPTRKYSSLKDSDVVTRIDNEIELQYYENEFKYLREGNFQFFKFLHKRNVDFSDKNITQAVDLFFFIQVERLISSSDGHILKRKYGLVANQSIESELIEVCHSIWQRLLKFSSIYLASINNNYFDLDKIIKNKVFFNKAEYYKIISQHRSFREDSFGKIYEKFSKLFLISPLDSYYSLFISYSVRDKVVANIIRQRLELRGVDVFMFDDDNPNGRLDKIMYTEINNRDKLLFISSEHSLQSPPCLFELKCVREKRLPWKYNPLIPITIDKEIQDILEIDIPSDKRNEVWPIISYIKDRNIKDFTFVHSEIDIKKIDFQIENIISDHLIKLKAIEA